MKREKYYLITYPSSWGMGSNYDTGLITETNLRELIIHETDRYRAGDRFADDRFSGTWNEEVFCDSDDPEEVIADVINKRLNTISTYAGHNDLILLPESIPVKVSDMKLENTIVRLTNQFGSGRDIIFGEGHFTLYSVYLNSAFLAEVGIDRSLESDCWTRFVDYRLNNVAENHMSGFNELSYLLRVEEDKLARMNAKQDGKEIKHRGAYITDLLPEIATPDYVADMIAEAQATIDKFSNLPVMEDSYSEHLYDLNNCRYEYRRQILEQIKEEDKAADHTQISYDYPISTKEFGTIYENTEHDGSHYLAYSELFQKGYDMRYLIADWSNKADSEEELGAPDLVAVFRSAFAYD
ncbi:MAG: hypothetical protein K6F54_03415 [Lachnospiraceae bacterium]|nr:hypothetical protein [Lachnospiraceae bacterium]